MKIPLNSNGALRPQTSMKAKCSVIANSRNDENVSSVCLGNYEYHTIEGVLKKERVQYLNTKKYGAWMHADCLSRGENYLVCYICNVAFNYL